MSIQKISEVEVIIRNILISQSGLNPQFVRNSMSIYGTSLDKETNESIFDTITQNDCLVLFDLESNGDLSISEDLNDLQDRIKLWKSYEVHIMIYGDESDTLANVLVSRLRTEEVRMILASQGVHFNDIDNVTTIHEFENEVIWLRSDFKMLIDFEMIVDRITKNDTFATLSQLTIDKT